MVESDLVLQHETRRMIYNHIVAHPGVSFNVLKEVFGLTDGTLRYHLDYLKRAEKITNGVTGGRRIYYPTSSGNIVSTMANGQVGTFKLNSIQERIVMILKRYPGINQKELADRTKLNRFKIRNNIDKLIDIGMVRKQPRGNTVYYEYISDGQMHFEMLKTLVMKLINGEIDDKTFLELKGKIE